MFIEEVRRFPELTQTAIMMLTSISQYAEIERCRSLGVSAYLIKPVRHRELQEAILRVLGETSAKVGARSPVTIETATASANPHVLLVEDHPINQRLAQTLLEKWNYVVTTVENGIEALAALRKTTVDLILMDLQMPAMDGFQTTAVIRRDELNTGRHVPIVALTAHAIEGDRQRCLAAGMDAYVSKPIRPEELKRVLHSLSVAPETPAPQQA